MADCGASGTALDRATNFLSGGGGTVATNGQAQKQLGSLLGHGALTGSATSNGAIMPVSRPDHISIPSGGGVEIDNLLVMQNNSLQQLPHQQRHYAASKGMLVNPRMQQARHQQQRVLANPRMQHMTIQQHQQHQQQTLAMQHQQMIMMQAQAQARTIQQKQQQQQQQTQSQSSLNQQDIESRPGDEPNYTEEGRVQGVTIDELASAWSEVENEAKTLLQDDDHYKPAEEGNVKGASVEELAAAWAEAQESYQSSGRDDFDLDSNQTYMDPSGFWADQNATSETPMYTFVNEVSRDTMEIPSGTNFMEEGMKHFNDGNISQAIKSFEMELQFNDPDSATAWRMLGRCHAENDQDREAITCLEAAVERDPYSPESQLALGVSYVNELNHAKAVSALKSWITMNPKYAGMEVDIGVNIRSNKDSDFHDVQNLLLKALEFDDSDAADVWEALGVAANVSRDFETAVEAFQKAIDARPNDYQLWNKLGATLANSNQSDKALPAYHKALQLKPKYARAWLNMAISHSNLQDFDEAARCYLQTLSLNPAAVHCWSYLRVALSCSERWDLIPFAASQNLNAFKEHFDFISS